MFTRQHKKINIMKRALKLSPLLSIYTEDFTQIENIEIYIIKDTDYNLSHTAMTLWNSSVYLKLLLRPLFHGRYIKE